MRSTSANLTLSFASLSEASLIDCLMLRAIFRMLGQCLKVGLRLLRSLLLILCRLLRVCVRVLRR
jgi:hypothetical protein